MDYVEQNIDDMIYSYDTPAISKALQRKEMGQNGSQVLRPVGQDNCGQHNLMDHGMIKEPEQISGSFYAFCD